MDITKLSETELKALICDERDRLDTANNNIRILRLELQKRQQPQKASRESIVTGKR